MREILDAGGLTRVRIFASGGLDEIDLLELVEGGAPIDGFGVGTRLVTSADAPALDCAYKLMEYAGRPRHKRSEGKATWPGRKQVYRSYAGGVMVQDEIALVDERIAGGTPLLEPAMRAGRRLRSDTLCAARSRAAAELEALPPTLRDLRNEAEYPIIHSPGLLALAREVLGYCVTPRSSASLI